MVLAALIGLERDRPILGCDPDPQTLVLMHCADVGRAG